MRNYSEILNLNVYMVRSILADSVLNCIPVSDLDGQEKTDRLHTVVAPVYIVAHEKVVCVRTPPAHPEELQQIIELTVHVSTHCHRGARGERWEIWDINTWIGLVWCGVVSVWPDMFDVALLHKNVPGCRAEVPDTGLGQEAAAVEILQPTINISQAGLQSSSSHVSCAALWSTSSYQLQSSAQLSAVQSHSMRLSSDVLRHDRLHSSNSNKTRKHQLNNDLQISFIYPVRKEKQGTRKHNTDIIILTRLVLDKTRKAGVFLWSAYVNMSSYTHQLKRLY